MPFKWVPIAAETRPESHGRQFGFCPVKPQLYRFVVKPLGQKIVVARNLLLADGQ
jgi:hypothetical protein